MSGADPPIGWRGFRGSQSFRHRGGQEGEAAAAQGKDGSRQGSGSEDVPESDRSFFESRGAAARLFARSDVPTGQAAPSDTEGTVHTGPIPVSPLPEPVAPDEAEAVEHNGTDWMERARQQAEADSLREASLATWVPGAEADDVVAIDLTDAAALVRPYARTGGRTRPVRELDMEALVHTTLAGKEASTSPWLNPEHTNIIEMCSGTVSVAEIAARLTVPLGVARVIIADMVDLGLVEVMKTSAAEGDERDPDFLRRVLSGLQRL